MTKLTKSQLVDELSALRQHCQRIEAELASLKASKPVRPTRPVYTPPAPTAEQLAFRAKLAAAREQAMRTGCSVLVG